MCAASVFLRDAWQFVTSPANSCSVGGTVADVALLYMPKSWEREGFVTRLRDGFGHCRIISRLFEPLNELGELLKIVGSGRGTCTKLLSTVCSVVNPLADLALSKFVKDVCLLGEQSFISRNVSLIERVGDIAGAIYDCVTLWEGRSLEKFKACASIVATAVPYIQKANLLPQVSVRQFQIVQVGATVIWQVARLVLNYQEESRKRDEARSGTKAVTEETGHEGGEEDPAPQPAPATAPS